MKLIVGLGNPGKEYENTRHNLGFWVIEQLAKELRVKLKQKKFNGLYYQTSGFILLQPQTGMNNSGECIREFMKYFHILAENILVIYDEAASSIGSFRYRSRNYTGNHNGVKSIIENLGTRNFKRLWLGIGYERFALHQWVLGKFSKAEEKEIEKISPVLLISLQEWLTGNDFEKIMNKYN